MDKNLTVISKRSKLFNQSHSFSFLSLSKVIGVKVSGFSLLHESIADNHVVVYGKYELIVCYRNKSGELETIYSLKTFAENIQFDHEPAAMRQLKGRRSDVEIKVYFDKGPDARVIPTPNQIIQTLMKLTNVNEWNKLQVEVNGEITVEMCLPEEKTAQISQPVLGEPAKTIQASESLASPGPAPLQGVRNTQTIYKTREREHYEILPVFRNKFNVNTEEYEKIVKQLINKNHKSK